MKTLPISLSILVSISIWMNFKLADHKDTISYTEMVHSCESGGAFYVLKYGSKNLSAKDKMKRIRFIADQCAGFTSTYLDFKLKKAKLNTVINSERAF